MRKTKMQNIIRYRIISQYFSCFCTLMMIIAPSSISASSDSSGKLISDIVEDAIIKAASPDDLVIEIRQVMKSDSCEIKKARVHGRIERSGTVRIFAEGNNSDGRACRAWLRAEIKVYAKVYVMQKDIFPGDDVISSVIRQKKEIRGPISPVSDIPRGSVANRRLGRGRVLVRGDIRESGPERGEIVSVVVVSGALRIEQKGRVVTCGQGRHCVMLPGGRVMEGEIVDGIMKIH